jgi:hypothetical protein
MNEELTKELNLLQEKFNKEIEDVKKKYEKVENINGWYKDDKFPNWIAYYDFDNNTMYGIDPGNEWFNMSIHAFKNNRLATPEEVEAALTKEAVKRYPVGTKFKSLNGGCDRFNGHVMRYDNGVLLLGDDYKRLEVFKDGVWAEIIKEKTLDELAIELSGKATNIIINKLRNEKQEVINILNNL